MLNSIGLQNPGVDAVIEKYAGDVGRLARAGDRQRRRRVGRGLRRGRAPARRRAGRRRHRAQHQLPERRARAGSSSRSMPRRAGEVTAAVRRATDLPLLVKLSPNVADVRPIARAIEDAGRRRADRDQHAVGDRRGAGPGAAAARQHVRRPVRPGDQARRAAGRLRGRPGRSASRSWPSAASPSSPTCSTSSRSARSRSRSARRSSRTRRCPVRLVDELAAECGRRGLDSHRPLIGTALPRKQAPFVREGRRIPAVGWARGARPMSPTDPAVDKALRADFWPALAGIGFNRRTGRTAWRDRPHCVQTVEHPVVQPVPCGPARDARRFPTA